MARNAKDDAERILAHLDRAANILERSSKTTERQHNLEGHRLLSYEKKLDKTSDALAQRRVAPSSGEVGFHTAMGALEGADLAHTAYSAAKWSDPTTNIPKLIGKAGTALGGEDSLTGMYSQHLATGATAANAIMKPTPMSITEAALEAPNILKHGNPIYGTYQLGKYGYGKAKGFVENAMSEGGKSFDAYSQAMRHETGERQAESAFESVEHASRIPAGGLGSAAMKTGALGYSVTAGGMAGGIAGAAGAGVVGLLAGPTLLRATERLREFSDKLHDTNSRFAEFSGGMSAVMAAQEVRDISLGRERGDRRALSAGYLAEGRHQLNTNMGRIEDFFATFKNLGTGLFDRLAGALTAPLGDVAAKLNEWTNDLAKRLGIEDPASQFNKEANEQWWEDFEQPPRFR